MRVFTVMSLFAAAIFSGFQQYSEQSFRRVAGDPYRVSYPDAEVDSNGNDGYGKYTFVLDPKRKKEDTQSHLELWQWPEQKNFTYSKLDVDGVEITLDCHKCYEGECISGGRMVLAFQGESWALGFHHVGAESVFYADELPPAWVDRLKEGQSREALPEDFLDQFESIYQSNSTGDKLQQAVTAKRIVSLLISTFNARITVP